MFENEKVNHVKFGEGSVMECDGSHIGIVFSYNNVEKTFAYPGVFDKFLVFESNGLQEETDRKLADIRTEQKKFDNMKRLMYLENEKRHKEELLAKAKKNRAER